MAEAPTLKRDRRREKSSATRQALIEATIRSIATWGLSKTTLTSVSELSGMSRGLVGFHFKSKGQMLIETLQFLENVYERDWHEKVVEVQLDPAEKLLACNDFDLDFALSHPTYLSVYFAFWGEARGNELYREVSLPRDRAYVAYTRGQIEKLIAEGGYRGLPAGVVAAAMNAITYGLWLDLHMDPEAFDAQQARAVTHSYLAGLFPRHFKV